MNSENLIDFLIEKGEFVDETTANGIKKIIRQDSKDKIRNDLEIFLKSNFSDFNTTEFFTTFFHERIKDGARVSILKSFEKTPNKRDVQDFVRYFNVRFKQIERMLKGRRELTGLMSIQNIKKKKSQDKVSLIGSILDIYKTKNGHFVLTIEDLTDTMKVIVAASNQDLIKIAEDLVLDEIIGISGNAKGDAIFAQEIIHPEIPLTKELKKSPFDNYVLFLGDLHIGAKEFLYDEFKKMILWLNGKLGTPEQREIARKVKYVILAGDVVEGVGIYPGQENDLVYPNMAKQYEVAAEYLKKIPSHIKIIISPGNHDTGRIAEPQLPIEKDYASSLWDLDNVIMVSNPAYVSLDVTEHFSGIDVLIYHGYSLPYYADTVPRIRSNGGLKAVDEIMKFLLQRRHLAPTHGSTLYIPDPYEDALLIDPIPDIFVTGHIHRVSYTSYRNVTCLNASCWTAITEDQEKRGLAPQPARVMLVSLKTRDVKIMNFSSGKDPSSVADLIKQKAQKAAKK